MPVDRRLLLARAARPAAERRPRPEHALLALQRRAGNRAVSAMVGRAPEAVQRAFGFEMELQLALGWGASAEPDRDRTDYGRPDGHLTKYPVIGTATGVELHLDHSDKLVELYPGGNAIVELVTDPPIDEATTTEEDVRQRMRQMAGLVGAFGHATGGLAHRAPLAGVAGVTAAQRDGHLFVGDAAKGGQTLDHAYVQNTVVVQLEKIPEHFLQMSQPGHNALPISRRALSAGVARANEIVELIVANSDKFGWELDLEGEDIVTRSAWGTVVPDGTDVAPVFRTELAPLTGLLALMVNYLINARFDQPNDNALVKNHIGLLFYKSRLSNVSAGLTGASRWMVRNKPVQLRSWLLKAAGRQAGEAFHTRTPQIKVQDWIKEVLAGASDPIFDVAKNEFSDEIAPYGVGPVGGERPGVALESRKTAPPGGYSYPDGAPSTDNPIPVESVNDRPVGEWEDVAVGVWTRLRALHGIV